MQLVDYAWPNAEDNGELYWKMLTKEGLVRVSEYANALGPAKDYFVPETYALLHLNIVLYLFGLI